jgi:hypothetical protein
MQCCNGSQSVGERPALTLPLQTTSCPVVFHWSEGHPDLTLRRAPGPKISVAARWSTVLTRARLPRMLMLICDGGNALCNGNHGGYRNHKRKNTYLFSEQTTVRTPPTNYIVTVCGGQTSPHKPRLVVSHCTCLPLSSSPHNFVLGAAVINNNLGPPAAGGHGSVTVLP